MTVWKEFRVNAAAEYGDLIADILIQLGSPGVSMKDRYTYDQQPERYLDTIWELDESKFPAEGVIVIAYFEATSDITKETIKEALNQDKIPYQKILSKQVAEEDWAYEWEKYYHAIPVGDEFLIVPIWQKDEHRDEDRKILYMDPGLAFGTGNHETTQLSIAALVEAVSGGETVLDVGTGSGILTIAVASLGASKIFAYDIDEQAVQSAQRNIALNDLSAEITVSKNSLLEGVDQKADIIVANILAPLIKEMMADAYKLLETGGYFIASGILTSQASEICELLEKNGFKETKVESSGEWVAIIARKS